MSENNRPDICTEIKEISGHYYVYSYHFIKLPSGRWGKKTDICIGKIVPDKSFIPNKNCVDVDHLEVEDDITVLEYSQYAFVNQIAANIQMDLEGCFLLDRGDQFFAMACILFVNSLVHIDQIHDFYEQNWLSVIMIPIPSQAFAYAISWA